jgi:hypothetical protein
MANLLSRVCGTQATMIEIGPYRFSQADAQATVHHAVKRPGIGDCSSR